MARLNFEDKWWTDERRFSLAEKLGGSLRLADGLMAEVWLTAQKFWGNGRKKVPAVVFNSIRDFEHLFDVDLAYRKGSLIYVRGTREWLEWYAKRIDAGASGGNKKKKNSSKRLANGVANAYPPAPAPAPAPAPEKPKPKDRSAMAPEGSGCHEFIGSYVKAYQTKYGNKARPNLGGKTLGGIKRLLADTPLPRACDMIQIYLQMDDPWFKTKAHDFETFAANLTKIGLALDTGLERPKGKGIAEILAEDERKKKESKAIAADGF